MPPDDKGYGLTRGQRLRWLAALYGRRGLVVLAVVNVELAAGVATWWLLTH